MAVERSHSTGDNAANVEDSSRTTESFVLQLFSSVLMEVMPSLEALVVPTVFFLSFGRLAQVCRGSPPVALGGQLKPHVF